MGVGMVTYDSSQSYRNENLEFFHYDAKTLNLISSATLLLKDGADPILANSSSPLRNESTDSNGVFKFISIAAGFYSVYATKSGYFDDTASVVSVGTYTSDQPYIYMLPTYDSD